MKLPHNWPDSFEYIPTAITVSFNEVLLEALLGTGYEEDQEKVVPLIDEKKVHEDLLIEILDESFTKKYGYEHPLSCYTEMLGHMSRGVFAAQPIQKETVLGEYGGVICFTEKKHTCSDGDPVNPYLWQIAIDEQLFFIDGFRGTNELGFVNRYENLAKEPNTLMRPVIHRGRLRFCYVTIKDIAAGEEILTVYKNF